MTKEVQCYRADFEYVHKLCKGKNGPQNRRELFQLRGSSVTSGCD